VFGRKLLLIHVGSNINLYVSDCTEEIYSTIYLRGYRAAGLCVYMLKDNIQKDVKEIALMTMRSEINLINK